MASKRGYARVLFEEASFAEDTVRGPRTGAGVLRSARATFERDGVPLSSLRRCDAEGRDGTRLPGCLKVYLPEPDGRFGMVLVLTGDEQGLGLHFLAFGVRHHPRDSHAPTVYEIAHRRLHG